MAAPPTTGDLSEDKSTITQLNEITVDADFIKTISSLDPKTLAVIYFHAPWAAPCQQMTIVLQTLAGSYPLESPPKITFLSLNAEELPDISEQYEVSAVPYVVLQMGGKTLDTISGSDAAKVRGAVEKYAGTGNSGITKKGLPPAQAVTKPEQKLPAPQSNGSKDLSAYVPDSSDPRTAPENSSSIEKEATKEELFSRLKGLVKAAPVMLFMKGTPSAPQCGFSRQTVSLLRERGIRYGFFNILADDEVRQGLKEFAEWPTYPQLWIDGELVGGLDIIKEELSNDPEFLQQYSVNAQKGGGGGPIAPDVQAQPA